MRKKGIVQQDEEGLILDDERGGLIMATIKTEQRGQETVYRVIGRPSRHPMHPGQILREDVLPALEVTITQASQDLGISRQFLHKILREEASITPEVAVRIGKFCGNGPGLWLRLQQNYDLWQAEQRLQQAVRAIPTRAPAHA